MNIYLYALAAGLLWVGSCGGDDDSDDDSFPATLTVVAEETAGETLTLDLSDAPSGSRYILLPLTVGSISGTDTVQGGGSETFNFTLSTTADASLHKAKPKAKNLTQELPTRSHYDHQVRTFVNRYHPRHNPLPQFRKRIEKDLQLLKIHGHFQPKPSPPINNRKHTPVTPLPKPPQLRDIPKNELALVDCDESGYLVGFHPEQSEPDVLGETYTITSGSDYCLYTPSDLAGLTETDLERIKNNIASSLSLYKTVIYNDDLDSTITVGEVDDYKFLPHIFVIPYSSDDWTENETYKISGAFSGSLSEQNEFPSLYIAADFSEIGIDTNANELFHSTIAHELQHAVLHYFRNKQGIAIDAAHIDEGIAHLMEDALGYGQVNFSDYPRQFLRGFASGLNPILASLTGAGSAAERGAAHTFFYFLASQKGGLNFGSQVSGGDGLSFIRDYVTSSRENVAGIITSYGGSETWLSTMMNYAAALAVDGASGIAPGSAFRVQSPVGGISNTAGDNSKAYGMRFHNYGGGPSLADQLEDLDSIGSSDIEVEITHYNTPLYILDVTGSGPTITLTPTDSAGSPENVALGAVRIR